MSSQWRFVMSDAVEQGWKAGGVKLAQIRLLRDTWVGEERIVADGSVIPMPAKDARRLIEAGVAERADPLPGE